ncbi:MAG: hypothetical protein GY774_36430 [Planctomycetes bacterium]|nr:hypothetical protein [Planctomycetota bacterium]
MDKPEKISPFLESSLNAYRSAVKSFGRETLILGLLAIAVCTLTISYLKWTGEKQAKEEKMKNIEKQLKAAPKAKLQLEKIQIIFSPEKENIRQIAIDTSADLVNRWQAFLGAIQDDFSIFNENPELFTEIKSLRSQFSPVSTEAANSPARGPDTSQMHIQRSIKNQLSLQDNDTSNLPEITPKSNKPERLPLEPEYLNAKTICKEIYGRSDEEINILLQPEVLKGNTFYDVRAYNIAIKVFESQIDWSYEQLNQCIRNSYDTFSKALDKNVQILNESLEAIDLEPLPTGKALLSEPNKAEPSELSSYDTVRKKENAMILVIKEFTDKMDDTNSDLNKLDANVRQAEEMLSERNKTMKSEICKLEKNITQAEVDIDKLQEQVKNLSKFTSWLPGGVTVGTQTFIRATPLLLGIILLLMGIRYSRLTLVYRRLSAEFRKIHTPKEEIVLILSVPDSLLEWFGGFQPGHLLSLRAVLLVIPVGIFFGICLLIHQIRQNPVIEKGGTEFFVASFISAGLGAILVYWTILRTNIKN